MPIVVFKRNHRTRYRADGQRT